MVPLRAVFTMSDDEFIKRTGAPEVLIEVAAGDKRFTDINENVEISSATLSNRLKEGKLEELWEEQLKHKPDGSARRVYVTLPRGRELAEEVEESDLLDIIDEIQEMEAEYEREINKLSGQERQTA